MRHMPLYDGTLWQPDGGGFLFAPRLLLLIPQELCHSRPDQQQLLHTHGSWLLREAWSDRRYRYFQSLLPPLHQVSQWSAGTDKGSHKLNEWVEFYALPAAFDGLLRKIWPTARREYTDLMFLHGPREFPENRSRHPHR